MLKPEPRALFSREAVARGEGCGDLGRVPINDDETWNDFEFRKYSGPLWSEEAEPGILDRPQWATHKTVPQELNQFGPIRIHRASGKTFEIQMARIIPRKAGPIQHTFVKIKDLKILEIAPGVVPRARRHQAIAETDTDILKSAGQGRGSAPMHS